MKHSHFLQLLILSISFNAFSNEATTQQRIKALLKFGFTMEKRGCMEKVSLPYFDTWQLTPCEDSNTLYYQKQLKKFQTNPVLLADIDALSKALEKFNFQILPDSTLELLAEPLTEVQWATFTPVSSQKVARNNFAHILTSKVELFGSSNEIKSPGMLDILNALDPKYHYRLLTSEEWREIILRLDSSCQVSNFLEGYGLEFLLRRAWLFPNANEQKPLGSTQRRCHIGKKSFSDLIGNVWEIVTHGNGFALVGGGFDTKANTIKLNSQADFATSLVKPIREDEFTDQPISIRLARSPKSEIERDEIK